MDAVYASFSLTHYLILLLPDHEIYWLFYFNWGMVAKNVQILNVYTGLEILGYLLFILNLAINLLQ